MSRLELQQGFIKCYEDFYNRVDGIKDLKHLFTFGEKRYGFAGFPTYMRFKGRKTVNRWVEANQNYLKDLAKDS